MNKQLIIIAYELGNHYDGVYSLLGSTIDTVLPASQIFSLPTASKPEIGHATVLARKRYQPAIHALVPRIVWWVLQKKGVDKPIIKGGTVGRRCPDLDEWAEEGFWCVQ